MIKDKERVNKKVTGILEKGYEAHYMLRRVLQNDTLFLENKDIIDVIFIQRKSMDSPDLKPETISPAKLLIATNYGILFMEEGFKEINDNYLGYKLKRIYYDKIDSVELDICMLNGNFRVITGGKENFVVEFNTASYYKQFEEFMKIIHDNITENK
ncbi:MULTISPECIES: hypothetical protein [Halanaerobium]|uniref:YokE-like PH domain-containing protein n=1 Tax=Halanaerobium kushneri TaxID=56779 RepID=A0A1N6ZSZ3_9FIRM|nr:MULTISPECIES: hypothetical protein [Halanaerobium]RCW53004.1 hypothetical protein DFR80_12437 [Halanaerobium sp. ST460_2HS_T2]SIR29894.1 hypothetical protein SAMN05421834_11937 [Halanaerobium kushneri]